MRYTINWAEKKTVTVAGAPKQILECSLIREDGSQFDATIWRDGKDGSVFPNFDTLAPGHALEANEWVNPKNQKISMFPPKSQNTPRGGANMTRVMEKKNENIKESQDRKEVAIKLASSMSHAVALAIAELEGKDKAALATRILQWRTWIIDNWGDMKDVVDPTK